MHYVPVYLSSFLIFAVKNEHIEPKNGAFFVLLSIFSES